MISQANCGAATPMGANLISDYLAAEMGGAGGGATFRVWAPRAAAVYLTGVFGGVSRSGLDDSLLMAKDANGYWSGFVAEADEGDAYGFYVVGEGSSGYKRDPYARGVGERSGASVSSLFVGDPVGRGLSVARCAATGVSDAGVFRDMVVYQLHIGTYAPAGT